jgi:hypothetical protein
LFALLRNLLQDAEKHLPAIEALFVALVPNPQAEQRRKITASEPRLDFDPRGGLKIPLAAFGKSPVFWTFYHEVSPLIAALVRKRPSLLGTTFRAFRFYPDLFEFAVRKAYFLRLFERRDLPRPFVEIDRRNIIESSFEAFRDFTSDQFRQGFRIRFKDEDGIDDGGPIREWFTVLVDQLFDRKFGLFEPSPNGLSYQPSGSSSNNLEYLEFTGKIIARAVMSDIPVGAHFMSAVSKFLLERPASLRDVDIVDHTVYKSLKKWFTEDVTDCGMVFAETVNARGDEIPFKPGGGDILVTNENKGEYVALARRYKLHGRIEAQLNALTKGFHSLIPVSEIQSFSVDELDLLICGIP